VYKNVVLDTDVVIHLLRHSAETVKLFTQFHQAGTLFLLSPIVIAEIYVGAFAEEYVTIEDFFSLCEFAPITAEIARQAGFYAKQYRTAYHKISLEDYLLAATAKTNHCPLWTYNLKHFPMGDIELLKVIK
jgi:predicted nucleic acid-binding protein